MQLLTTPDEIEGAISRLMKQYRIYDWAVAWASVGFPAFVQLAKMKAKARRIIVGTHFYQTHPDFIETFADLPAVRYVLQPNGVYHPKVYLFENSPSEWACIVGSANFTGAAFSKNSEAAVVFDSTELNANELRASVDGMIDIAWSKAKNISKAELIAYRLLWTRYRPIRRRMAGEFGEKPSSKSVTETKMFRHDWPAYLAALRADPHQDFSVRLKVLAFMRDYFDRGQPFNAFPEEERRQIAGFAPDGVVPWRYFGSMQGAGRFKNAVLRNAPELSTALDRIPIDHEVNQAHFDAFIAEFVKAFPNGGDGLATATRLLAMKRPDVFVCVDSENIELLADDFGVPPNRLKNNYDSYWPEIIERIQETSWWQSPPPRDPNEHAVWRGRAALLDAVYYDPKDR